MSVNAMSQVWTLPLGKAEKLVLLNLAYRANDSGICWPSTATIALECGLTQRSVFRTLKQLEDQGRIEKVSSDKKSNTYRLHLNNPHGGQGGRGDCDAMTYDTMSYDAMTYDTMSYDTMSEAPMTLCQGGYDTVSYKSTLKDHMKETPLPPKGGNAADAALVADATVGGAPHAEDNAPRGREASPLVVDLTEEDAAAEGCPPSSTGAPTSMGAGTVAALVAPSVGITVDATPPCESAVHYVEGSLLDMPQTAAESPENAAKGGIVSDTSSAPEKTSKKGNTKKSGQYDEEFEAFWSAYPRKDNKKAAYKAWCKAKKEGRLPDTDTLIAHVSAGGQSQQWQKDGGQYVPMASTFINGDRWEDSICKVEEEVEIPRYLGAEAYGPEWVDDLRRLEALEKELKEAIDAHFAGKVPFAVLAEAQRRYDDLLADLQNRGCPACF